MENEIENWLNFATEVEAKLAVINTGIFSDKYNLKLSNLLKQLRDEASLVKNLSPIEKQEHFLKINSIGTELKTTAYFY